MARGEPALRVIDGGGELREDLTALPTEEAALVEVIVKQRREIAGYKAELTKMRKVDPDQESIMEVLEYWRDKTNHPQAQIPVDGKRFKVVKSRLQDGFEVAQLKRAIDGVAAFPHATKYDKRYAEPGEGRKRKDELAVDVLRDEAQTEKRIKLAEGTGPMQSYRWFLHQLLLEKPWMAHALAMLGEHESVHGEVLASAVLWAKDKR